MFSHLQQAPLPLAQEQPQPQTHSTSSSLFDISQPKSYPRTPQTNHRFLQTQALTPTSVKFTDISNPKPAFTSHRIGAFTPSKPSPLSPHSRNANRLPLPPTPATMAISKPAIDEDEDTTLAHAYERSSSPLLPSSPTGPRSSQTSNAFPTFNFTPSRDFTFSPNTLSANKSATRRAQDSFRTRAEEASPLSRIFNHRDAPSNPETNSNGRPSRTPTSKPKSPSLTSGAPNRTPRATAFLNRIRRDRDDEKFEKRGDQLLRMDFIKERRRWEQAMERESDGMIDLDEELEMRAQNPNQDQMMESENGDMLDPAAFVDEDMDIMLEMEEEIVDDGYPSTNAWRDGAGGMEDSDGEYDRLFMDVVLSQDDVMRDGMDMGMDMSH